MRTSHWESQALIKAGAVSARGALELEPCRRAPQTVLSVLSAALTFPYHLGGSTFQEPRLAHHGETGLKAGAPCVSSLLSATCHECTPGTSVSRARSQKWKRGGNSVVGQAMSPPQSSQAPRSNSIASSTGNTPSQSPPLPGPLPCARHCLKGFTCSIQGTAGLSGLSQTPPHYLWPRSGGQISSPFLGQDRRTLLGI